MVKHYNRSHSDESAYLYEEEMGFHPDEDELWYSKSSLWYRAQNSLWNSSTEQKKYFDDNIYGE